jgi:inner membrane protein
MANALDHRLMAAACVGGVAAADWKEGDHWVKHPMAAAGMAASCGTLPDLIEPALHPNHRQFFHSIAFAFGVGIGLHQLYQWKPDTNPGRVLRGVLLVGGAAYLIHLAMDACTRKSLPLLGKL